MDPKTKSLLYQYPHLYEVLYPEPDNKTYASPTICRTIIDKFHNKAPQSILDIGCGTGRFINHLSENCPDCTGVDFLPEMVEFAKLRYNHIDFIQGDMRSFRLDRTFDLLICMGSTFMHALTNSDIEATLDTFATHSHKGSLLIIDIKNCIGFINKTMEETIEQEIQAQEFKGKHITHRIFDLGKQLWIWKRTWHIPGREMVEDYLEFRMLFPREIEYYLTKSGYSVLGIFDNPELQDSNYTGDRLYIAATYLGTK
jgi:SAM-dependent methyltransferase